MGRLTILPAVLLCSLVASPAASYAQDDAGVDEYTEHVPSGGGDKPSDQVDQTGGGAGGGLPPGAAHELGELGPDGVAAAALADATAPRANSTRGQSDQEEGSGIGTDSGSQGLGASGDGDGIGDALGNILGGGSSDGQGLGVILPLILAATALAAIGVALARRRRDSEPGAG